MNRFLYSLAVWLLLPWAALYLLWRGRRQPEYRRHWRERFGWLDRRADRPPTLWLHAVSVGETRAAEALIRALLERYPEHRLLLTHMTPTGRQTSLELFGDRVDRAYLPYDTGFGVERFLDHWQPALGLIMETELWPNLIERCQRRAIPVLLVNGRLSERSAARYRRFPELTRQTLAGLAATLAQGDADADRLRRLGATAPQVFGNMKFDIEPPEPLLRLGGQFRLRCAGRPMLLCASTRDGEEALILDAWRRLAPAVLLIVVPRHPQRFDEVERLISAAGLTVQRRSDDRPLAAATQVWLGDSMGELFAYYAACDLAFVGGSLLDYGGQNLIEPCAVGKPVLIGPSVFNFAEIAAAARTAGAATAVADADDLVATALRLLADPLDRQRKSESARDFAARHRGATARTLAAIGEFIPAAR